MEVGVWLPPLQPGSGCLQIAYDVSRGRLRLCHNPPAMPEPSKPLATDSVVRAVTNLYYNGRGSPAGAAAALSPPCGSSPHSPSWTAELRILLDGSSVEVFDCSGRSAPCTTRCYRMPPPPDAFGFTRAAPGSAAQQAVWRRACAAASVELFSLGGRAIITRAEAWAMGSAFKAEDR